MLLHFAVFFAVATLVRTTATFSGFTIETDAQECQSTLCTKVAAASPITLADIEGCLDASPATCTFQVSFFNSGSTSKVCADEIGFSLEDLVSPVGAPTAWISGYTPTATIDQGVASQETCRYGLYHTPGCDTEGTHVMAVTPASQPFDLDLKLFPVSTLPAFVVFRHSITDPSANCQKLIVSVDFKSLALRLTVAGRIGGNGDGNSSASANLVAGLAAFGVLYAWLTN
eukprot:Gregarina_sp_Pseudo_9__2477@NODE_2759_length_881_cov_5_237530_g2524_i0_p1_GENE_NODE_2759_length_881_cov_5_237530_g2524_i0NODE_2759_length_881_cov_5_237530_g2524_i0_p1_ORF_typecomplete_len229_score39_35_NODE_2759_length_881_cov_5_237530_g2524_i068754